MLSELSRVEGLWLSKHVAPGPPSLGTLPSHLHQQPLRPLITDRAPDWAGSSLSDHLSAVPPLAWKHCHIGSKTVESPADITEYLTSATLHHCWIFF